MPSLHFIPNLLLVTITHILTYNRSHNSFITTSSLSIDTYISLTNSLTTLLPSHNKMVSGGQRNWKSELQA